MRANQVKNLRERIMKKILCTACVFVCALAPSLSQAANPEAARLKIYFNRNAQNNLEGPIRIRVIHNFVDAAVETGGSCEVELSVCTSEFYPKGLPPDVDARECVPEVIGTATVEGGQSTVRFRTTTHPLTARRFHQQLSFQTQSTCVDASDNESVIISNSRAKKISESNGVGKARRTVLRFLRQGLSYSAS